MKLRPEQLVLITDPNHPAYDPRVHRPINEERVQSILRFGVKTPVKVKKLDGKWVVVDGRGRTQDAREANRRLLAEGKSPITIECAEDDSDDVFEASIVGNSLREDDDPITLAHKIERYLTGRDRTPSQPRTTKDAVAAFGCSAPKIQTLRRLLLLDATIQEAIKTGKIGYSCCVPWTRLPRHKQLQEYTNWWQTRDQPQRVEAVLPGGPGFFYGEAPKREGDQDPDSDLYITEEIRPKTRLRGKQLGQTKLRLREVLRKLEDADLERYDPDAEVALEGVRVLLKWVVGELSDKDLCKGVPHMSDFI